MKYQKIYRDAVIEVSITSEITNPDLKNIALKYIKPENYYDNKEIEISVSNAMGGETDWFILPSTFGEVIGKNYLNNIVQDLQDLKKKEFNSLKNG